MIQFRAGRYSGQIPGRGDTAATPFDDEDEQFCTVCDDGFNCECEKTDDFDDEAYDPTLDQLYF
jgi:hypothetical protein